MNKIFITIAGLLFCSYRGYSQNCTDANVSSIPGKWILISENNEKGISPTKLKERALLSEVHNFIQKNFPWSPVGGDVRHEGILIDNDFRPFSISNICDKYYYSLSYNHYFCAAGKVLHEETADYFQTTFNDLPFQFDMTFYVPQTKLNEGDIDSRKLDSYAVMDWIPSMKNGYLEYIKNSQDSTGEVPGAIYRYRILTKPGILPYVLMQKKEYYEKWRKRHLIEIENYKSDKERLSKGLAGNKDLPGLLNLMDQNISNIQKSVDKIDYILKTKSTEDLSKPAYSFEENGDFFQSRLASDYLRAYIVKPNPAYYNKQLPKSSPQVITLLLKYGMGKDENGNKHYADENFYQALDKMKILDLLSEKFKPLLAN